MTLFRIILICALFVSSTCQVSAQHIGFTLPPDSTKVNIPYREFNNLIVIKVNINGRAVLDFILDTSVQYSILTDKSIGDELGLNYIREVPMGKSSESTNLGYEANELNLELSEGDGVMTNDNHSILVLENDFMDLSNLAQSPVHGLIGKDIFEPFVVEIDRNMKQLVLHDPESFSVPNGYVSIPLAFENGIPKINVKTIFENWDELGEDMLLKTGAPHTILFDSDQNIFLVPPKKIESILEVNESIQVEGHIGRVREVKIGEFVFEDAIASFTKEQTKEVNRGSVGMGLLSRLDMIIDFRGKRMLVKQSKNSIKGFEYNLSGIKISMEGEQYFIRYVQKGSPSEEAGIVVGDQLMAVNGEKLSSKNFNEVVSMFSKKPDKKITLTLLKDGLKKDISFRLVRFI